MEEAPRGSRPAGRAVEVAPAPSAPSRDPHAPVRLDDIIDAETDLTPIADSEARPLITPFVYQTIMTAYRGYRDRPFLLRGILARQHGLRPEDAEAIGTIAGVGARFRVDIPGKAKPVRITVHTLTLETTMPLQGLVGRPVELEVAVQIADAPPPFRGIRWFFTDKLFQWTFRVDRIVGA